MDPDILLLERWRSGDRQAAQTLFERYFPEIYRFFQHKVEREADDLAQRTFLACVAAREQFRQQSSFRTYLFTIARNELYRHFRSRPGDAEVDFDAISVAELVTPASAKVDRARMVGHMRDALRELPAEQQLLLELHYWHDLDAEALGEVFSAAPATIRVRLTRARAALRARLEGSAFGIAPDDPLAASLRDPDG
jgi:RNA polymerase sigma factor (sigma-70 family)